MSDEDGIKWPKAYLELGPMEISPADLHLQLLKFGGLQITWISKTEEKKLKYRQVLKQQYVLEVPNFPFIVLNSLRKITYRYLLRQQFKFSFEKYKYSAHCQLYFLH